jgi:hypothetical protein
LITFLKTILGAIIGAGLILSISRVIPFHPDLSDWGGRAYPQSYLTPLIVLAAISYISGWLGAQISPVSGRLCGMLGSLLAGAAIIGWSYGGTLMTPLFHHPAYPMFSDHALLALAVLLVCGHLGGLRVERAFLNRNPESASGLSVSPNLP